MELLECNICFEEYSDDDDDHIPKVLKCGHTICQSCAAKSIKNSEMQCPTCRGITEVKGGDVKNLQKNFELIKAIEMMKADASKPATSVDSPPKCKEHPYYLAEFVCVEICCSSKDKLMCRTCEKHGIHKGHVTELLMTEAAKRREIIESRLKQMKLNNQDLEKQVEELKEANEYKNEIRIKKFEEVNNHFKELHKLLDEKKNAIERRIFLYSKQIHVRNRETEDCLKWWQNQLIEKLEQTEEYSKMNDYDLFNAGIELEGFTWYHSPITQKFPPADTNTMDVLLPTFKFNDEN